MYITYEVICEYKIIYVYIKCIMSQYQGNNVDDYKMYNFTDISFKHICV